MGGACSLSRRPEGGHLGPLEPPEGSPPLTAVPVAGPGPSPITGCLGLRPAHAIPGHAGASSSSASGSQGPPPWGPQGRAEGVLLVRAGQVSRVRANCLCTCQGPRAGPCSIPAWPLHPMRPPGAGVLSGGV